MSDPDSTPNTSYVDGANLTSGSITIPEGSGTFVPPPQTVSIIASNGTPMVTIHADEGRIEYGPDYQPDQAGRLFWEALQYMAPASKAQHTLQRVADEARMLCECCGDNRRRMRRIRTLLDLPVEDQPEEGQR